MNSWSATQRQYLEAMGVQLWDIGGDTAQAAPLATPPAIEMPTARPSAVAEHPLSAQLQKHLARAANIAFDELVQRVYLPPDLATNPHAKRAFWHVLKGLRSA